MEIYEIYATHVSWMRNSRTIVQFIVTYTENIDLELGKGNLIFCCTGLTNPNFHKIKITVISHLNIFDFYHLFFFSYTMNW